MDEKHVEISISERLPFNWFLERNEFSIVPTTCFSSLCLRVLWLVFSSIPSSRESA